MRHAYVFSRDFFRESFLSHTDGLNTGGNDANFEGSFCGSFPFFVSSRIDKKILHGGFIMKKILSLCLSLLFGASAAALSACSEDGISVAVPNDATNEARALLLLEDLGYIALDADAGITATPRDIVDNPYGLRFVEMEAGQIPRALQDVDYAVINSNYALDAGIDPVNDSLAVESAEDNPYSNILAVRAGNENSPAILALVAALSSQQVADFIETEYSGAVISSVSDPGTGFDDSIDYAALAGTTIRVAATPTPHAEILAVAAEILEERSITLQIIEYTDYVQPNNAVNDGAVDANYFQHLPYLEDFNASNGTNIVSVLAVHLEPLGLYGGKQSSLDGITAGK